MNYDLMQVRLNEVLAGTHDHFFADVINGIHCMSRPRVYAAINAIVGCIEPGEIYLEVGTYQGGSLVGALIGNKSHAIAVDSFNEFTATNSLERTKTNLEKFCVSERVQFYDMDFRRFFSEKAGSDLKAQVYYYDGAHDFETQLAGMEAAWPFLHSGSIIMVDDYAYPEVNQAVNQFVANHVREVCFQFVMGNSPGKSLDPIWWNGFVALRVL